MLLTVVISSSSDPPVVIIRGKSVISRGVVKVADGECAGDNAGALLDGFRFDDNPFDDGDDDVFGILGWDFGQDAFRTVLGK